MFIGIDNRWVEALRWARSATDMPREKRDGVYVCLCRGLTEKDVRRAARAGATTGPVLIATLGLDDPRCCGRCARAIDRYVALAEATVARAASATVA